VPISGAHVVLYSTDPEADRRFFRDTLGFSYVDAGDGWLIFALPPAEVAIHPAKSSRESDAHSLFLICDNLGETVASLRRKNVKCNYLEEQSWGKVAMITLPSGAELGLYEPRHPLARSPGASRSARTSTP
jgi:catechol 2,3-dioxygenase-like lactoylglutathione lyase family enzyme